MAISPRKAKTNRKKQNGKGVIVLTVFIISILVVLVAAYYFFAWHPRQQVPAIKPQPKTAIRTGSAASGGSLPTQPLPAPVVTSVPQVTVQETNPKTPDQYSATDQSSVQSRPAEPSVGNAELAIIVDDMGSSLQEIKALTALGVPLTYAIIPGLRYDREVAEYAAGQGGQVMVHIPMQSKEYPQRRLESNGLLLSYGEQELRERVAEYFERVPHAKGANNHTGSAFTEDEAKMRTVLTMLKHKGLFFVDSITTPATTGLKVASGLHLKSARRDIFLDNEQNEAYIKGQLHKAVVQARKHGRAIAICHPHPATIATLTKVLPDLQQREGIKLVFVSRLVK